MEQVTSVGSQSVALLGPLGVSLWAHLGILGIALLLRDGVVSGCHLLRQRTLWQISLPNI